MQKKILITSNSSWYLNHYRKDLTSKILKIYKNLIVISPVDSSTKNLNPNIIHIPWNISRKGYFNFFRFFVEIIQTIAVIKVLKPSIIHSHTLKSNVLISIPAALFNIKTIFSFAGFGILKTKGFVGIFFLKSILRTIVFLSSISRDSKNIFNNSRVFFIFQNPKDKKFFENLFFNRKDILSSSRLIPGSGVPSVYFKNKNQISKKGVERKIKNVIFCGRLLKSKGISKFLEISKEFKNLNFLVYGNIDINNNDSIKLEELEELEKLKNNSNIIFKGNTKDPLLNHLGIDSLLMVPSSYGEGLSRSIAEALFLKIPVIASKESINGSFTDDILFISKNNVKCYVELLKNLNNNFASPQILSKIEAGYKFAIQNLSEEQINEKTLKLYKELSQKNIFNKFEFKFSKENPKWLN